MHTSGLPDYEDLVAAAEKGRAPIWTAVRQIGDDEVPALLRGETKGRFAPGTSWACSNSGYVLLGLVVARVGGKPFGEFLRHRVFAPPARWDEALRVSELSRDDLDLRALALEVAASRLAEDPGRWAFDSALLPKEALVIRRWSSWL